MSQGWGESRPSSPAGCSCLRTAQGLPVGAQPRTSTSRQKTSTRAFHLGIARLGGSGGKACQHSGTSAARPATTRAGRITARRSQRRQRQAQQPGRYRPVELSIRTAIDQVVEGQKSDTFGIAVRSLCVLPSFLGVRPPSGCTRSGTRPSSGSTPGPPADGVGGPHRPGRGDPSPSTS
jgi:hypothetical protein